MFKKAIIAVAFAALAFGQMAKAQNVQMFYDFGKDRQYITTTFEMYKADKFGDTFWFIDHNFATSSQYDAGVASAVNGTYFEIERGINFWQDSALKDLSAHVEYDGSSWGAGIVCLGAKYFLHSADYSNMLTLYLMYDQHIGVGSADIPVKFSAVWGMNNLFGARGLVFSGFADFWWEDHEWYAVAQNPDAEPGITKCVFISEPQLWYNIGHFFNCENLYIGGEVEVSCNFSGKVAAATRGWEVNPAAGIKWVF